MTSTTKFPITGYTIRMGTGYDTLRKNTKEMLESAETLITLIFEPSYFDWWYPSLDFEPATEFPEIKNLTLVLKPTLHIDRTYHKEMYGVKESITGPLEKLALWIKKHNCPNLQSITLYWFETSYIQIKYFTGYTDGYDEYGPIEEIDYDGVDEFLNGNLLVEYFMPDLALDFSNFPESVKVISMPSVLVEKSQSHEGLCFQVDVLEDFADREAFDKILENYTS